MINYGGRFFILGARYFFVRLHNNIIYVSLLTETD